MRIFYIILLCTYNFLLTHNKLLVFFFMILFEWVKDPPTPLLFSPLLSKKLYTLCPSSCNIFNFEITYNLESRVNYIFTFHKNNIKEKSQNCLIFMISSPLPPHFCQLLKTLQNTILFVL